MKIVIEYNTENADFEDNRMMTITRVMQKVKERVLDCVYDGISPIRTPIKDKNGNRVGTIEINLD